MATCEKRKAVPMRVLVLGSRGVIGRALVRRLISSGYVVKERDILISREHDLSSASTLSKLANIIDDSDFVFFLAYDVGGSKYISNPTLQFMNNNSRIMLNTFPLLARKRFIFASSTMSNMNIAYGALKMVGEHYTKILGGVSARFWNVYGPQEPGLKAHAITDFIDSFVKTGTIKLLTDGSEQRQLLHSADCASCLEAMMLNYEHMPPIVDVSSFQWTTIWDVAKLVGEKVIEGKSQGDSHSFMNEPNDFILKFWKPRITLKDGIGELLYQKLSRKGYETLTTVESKEGCKNTDLSAQEEKPLRTDRVNLVQGWTNI